MKWAAKIAAKLFLARLRLPYRVWHRAGFFCHGKMEEPDYAISVFQQHLKHSFPHGLPPGATVIELGPGDSIASALIARAHGATRIFLIDVGTYASRDVGIYKDLARRLRQQGHPVPDIADVTTVEQCLERCGARYLTEGLDSLRSLPDQSADLIWSQAVLEHVRKSTFEDTMTQLRRILKMQGKASHAIDFKDHLAGGLNHLRFPERIWESDLFAGSGFYTNRLRLSAMVDVFKRCGFADIHLVKTTSWTDLPLARARLDSSFQGLPDDELLVNSVRVVMSRAS
jgi:hypothetical protein